MHHWFALSRVKHKSLLYYQDHFDFSQIKRERKRFSMWRFVKILDLLRCSQTLTRGHEATMTPRLSVLRPPFIAMTLTKAVLYLIVKCLKSRALNLLVFLNRLQENFQFVYDFLISLERANLHVAAISVTSIIILMLGKYVINPPVQQRIRIPIPCELIVVSYSFMILGTENPQAKNICFDYFASNALLPCFSPT